MNLTLTRIYSKEDCTIGVLADGNTLLCYTLENPWRDNQKDISCIPTGHYTCKPHSRRHSDTWRIVGVPDRKGIVFHSGNTESDTRGCILPGSVIGSLERKRAVLGSRRALNKLRDHIGTSNVFDLTIKEL